MATLQHTGLSDDDNVKRLKEIISSLDQKDVRIVCQSGKITLTSSLLLIISSRFFRDILRDIFEHRSRLDHEPVTIFLPDFESDSVDGVIQCMKTGEYTATSESHLREMSHLMSMIFPQSTKSHEKGHADAESLVDPLQTLDPIKVEPLEYLSEHNNGGSREFGDFTKCSSCGEPFKSDSDDSTWCQECLQYLMGVSPTDAKIVTRDPTQSGPSRVAVHKKKSLTDKEMKSTPGQGHNKSSKKRQSDSESASPPKKVQKVFKMKHATQIPGVSSELMDDIWNLRRQINDLDPQATSEWPVSDWESDKHFREEWIKDIEKHQEGIIAVKTVQSKDVRVWFQYLKDEEDPRKSRYRCRTCFANCDRMEITGIHKPNLADGLGILLKGAKENSCKIRSHIMCKGIHARIINQLNQEEKERLTKTLTRLSQKSPNKP